MAYLEEIVAGRRRRVRAEGPELGEAVPSRREQPLVPLLAPELDTGPLLVCEIKRRSPSRGAISPGLDAVEQARRYVAAGVRAVSVLTEPDHFGGALADLIAVKAAFPQLGVLRKDFLLDAERPGGLLARGSGCGVAAGRLSVRTGARRLARTRRGAGHDAPGGGA